MLIVEVLANRQAVHSDEEEEADASAMKFTFNKEDLLEVSSKQNARLVA